MHFLSDPERAKNLVALLVVGEDSVAEMRRLLKDVEQQTTMRC
jgi:hypothetical protein